MDLGLEYLCSKHARIVYLASYPVLNEDMLKPRKGNIESGNIICSRPWNILMIKFVVTCSANKLGLSIEDGNISSMLQIREIYPYSSLKGKLQIGDYIYSINGDHVGDMSILQFQKFLQSMPSSMIKKMVIYRKEIQSPSSEENSLDDYQDDVFAYEPSLHRQDTTRRAEFMSKVANIEVQSLVENIIVKTDKSPVLLRKCWSVCGNLFMIIDLQILETEK